VTQVHFAEQDLADSIASFGRQHAAKGIAEERAYPRISTFPCGERSCRGCRRFKAYSIHNADIDALAIACARWIVRQAYAALTETRLSQQDATEAVGKKGYSLL